MSLPIRPETLHRIAEVAARVDALGWGEATAGNLSLLLSGEDLTAPFERAGAPLSVAVSAWSADRYLLVTGTGTRMREIAADPGRGLGLVGLHAGAFYAARDSTPPSSELPVHLSALAERAPGAALLHSHPDFLIALTHLDILRGEGVLSRSLLPMMPETRLFIGRGIKRLDFELPGSRELGALSAAALREADILVWDRHGALAVGDSPVQALDRLELAEKAARVWWIAHRTGGAPRGLPEDMFDRLHARLGGA